MRAVVVGASGFVGRTILARLGAERAIGTGHRNTRGGLDHFDALTHGFADLRPAMRGEFSHVIVAHGAINPEQCARDPEGTARINVDSIIRLVSEVIAAGLTPVFLSTDYVFDGTRGLRREDEPQCPNTEYGRQKAKVEQWLQGRSEPWLIARLSKVVSGDRNIHSVLGQWVNDICDGKLMRSATDQIISPLHVDDIAGALIELMEKCATGIYHVAGPDPISRYDLNKLLVGCIQAVDPNVRATVEPCSLRDIPFLEQRPLNTSLSVEKLQTTVKYPLRSMAQVCREIAEAQFKAQ
ncbi:MULTISPECIES: SDR family oxidoreductase [unclassified Bradyrhizobium]|uniref:SDR family oxidoreductase n=1 Tax=unclassified Bradyrhizobium TaxID=2631580 RepID=UPI002915F9AE|nr:MULTISPECIES: sugar nucleotide-binding protein [unclassified Bradyrhizobium]